MALVADVGVGVELDPEGPSIDGVGVSEWDEEEDDEEDAPPDLRKGLRRERRFG
jgi:hypothetical protein